MKAKMFIGLLAAVFVCGHARAQFVKAELQAAGLTCSMCSRAVDKQLRTLEFIDSVGIDLERATFILYFRRDADVDLGKIKKKVEDAGFSVAMLKAVYVFRDFDAGVNTSFTDHGRTYFLYNPSGILNGEVVLKVIDKGYLSDKEFKKYAAWVKGKEGQGAFHLQFMKS